jgi:endogenous inhibitor of DNA gyrase (YacG/DUF329 family)
VKSATCPTCKAPVVKGAPGLEKLFPFCSERCHLVDLGRWLGEEYRIAEDPSYAASALGADDDA